MREEPTAYRVPDPGVRALFSEASRYQAWLDVAVWIDELCRHVERLRGAEGRVFVAMLGGGAGTMASLGPIGMAVQQKMAERLGMGAMSLPARYIGLCGQFAEDAALRARDTVLALARAGFPRD